MFFLLFGLLVFLGTHSFRVGGELRRNVLIQRWGEAKFKTVYALLSLLGLAMTIYGFGVARESPVLLWTPPSGMRHVSFLLMLGSMVLLAAAYVPKNGIRARLHHPMVLSVKVWALSHLLVNGTLAHGVLFGSFLVWSVFLFRASRRRDKVLAVHYPAGRASATAITVGLGLFLWLALLGWLHGVLIGVRLIG